MTVVSSRKFVSLDGASRVGGWIVDDLFVVKDDKTMRPITGRLHVAPSNQV